MNRILLFLLALNALGPLSPVQAADGPRATQESRELFETIKRMDAIVFEAFNDHKVDLLMSYFTDDLEFYQDNDGLKTYGETSDDFRTLFASVADIRRQLVGDSLEVYPIKDHGAIEIGKHSFCHREGSSDDCGTFSFAMVWRKTGDVWKISRVLSYGHQMRP